MWNYRPAEEGRSAVDVSGFGVEAIDGSIGKVDAASYETDASLIVVDTGPWIFGKKVMLPAGVIDRIDYDDHKVFVHRTKDEIKHSPEYDDTLSADMTYRARLAELLRPGGRGLPRVGHARPPDVAPVGAPNGEGGGRDRLPPRASVLRDRLGRCDERLLVHGLRAAGDRDADEREDAAPRPSRRRSATRRPGSETAPRSMPMSTIATISGRPVAPKRASAAMERRPSSRSQRNADTPRDDEQQAEEHRREQQARRRVRKLSRSNVIPVTTK